jgi:hypothetical protein
MARSRSMARSRTARAIAPQTRTCSVCGGTDVALDEVFERGLWLLAECRRCEHQWTEGPVGGPRGPVARALAAVAEEQVAAA